MNYFSNAIVGRRNAWMFPFAPDQFKIREMSENVVRRNASMFEYVPDKFKAQEMGTNLLRRRFFSAFDFIPDNLMSQVCEQAVKEKDTYFLFRRVADKFKTQEMCESAFRRNAYMFEYVPDKFKTQEMCEQAVKNFYRFLLMYQTSLKPQRCVKM